MNVGDAIRAIRNQIKSILGAITELQDGVDTAGSHNLLSATHPDVTVGAPARGDLIVGQEATPVWKKKALGANGKVVQSDGSDVVYDDVNWANIKKAGSDLADLAAKDHVDLDNIGEDDHHAKAHALDSMVAHSAAADNTDHDTSTAKHGLCPKLPDDDTLYLDGKGNWTSSGGGGGGWTFWDPDMFPVGSGLPPAEADHFDDDLIFESGSIWTEFDPGASPSITVTEEDHHLKIAHATEASWRYRGIYQTLPSGDFTITMKFRIFSRMDKTFGIALALFQDANDNPTTCDIVCLEFRTSTLGWSALRLNDYSSWAATYYSTSPGHGDFVSGYMRIRRNGTNLFFDISNDGVGWLQLGAATAQPFAAEQFGILTTNQNSGETLYAWIDWIYYENADNKFSTGALRSV